MAEDDAQRLERTAYHEAGHVVAAYVLGRPFVYVTIEADEDDRGGARGHVRYTRSRLNKRDQKAYRARTFSPRLRGLIERLIVVLYAGRAAEERRWSDYDMVGCGEDLDVASEALLALTNADQLADALGEQLLQRARALVGQRAEWTAVGRLAAELLRRPRLDSRQACRILRGAGVTRPPSARQPCPNGRGGPWAQR